MRQPFHWLLLVFFLATISSVDGQPVFNLSYATAAGEQSLTGRMFLVLAHSDSVEPRLQVGRYGTQFFGVDFVGLKPAQAIRIDNTTLGYPINALKDIPPGDYYVQAILDKYTEFKRSDGHTLWMHADQWEGQDWRRSPGNLYSPVMKSPSIRLWRTPGPLA